MSEFRGVVGFWVFGLVLMFGVKPASLAGQIATFLLGVVVVAFGGYLAWRMSQLPPNE